MQTLSMQSSAIRDPRLHFSDHFAQKGVMQRQRAVELDLIDFVENIVFLGHALGLFGGVFFKEFLQGIWGKSFRPSRSEEGNECVEVVVAKQHGAVEVGHELEDAGTCGRCLVRCHL